MEWQGRTSMSKTGGRFIWYAVTVGLLLGGLTSGVSADPVLNPNNDTWYEAVDTELTWPEARVTRPLELWRPELVAAPEVPVLPAIFRWRGRDFEMLAATGPERIAPEWWLDEPEWRTGVRDYWRVTTRSGERLWLYFAHGAALSAGWFCQGRFA